MPDLDGHSSRQTGARSSREKRARVSLGLEISPVIFSNLYDTYKRRPAPPLPLFREEAGLGYLGFVVDEQTYEVAIDKHGPPGNPPKRIEIDISEWKVEINHKRR